METASRPVGRGGNFNDEKALGKHLAGVKANARMRGFRVDYYRLEV